MDGDIPFAIYSFEHAAIFEDRLSMFARADLSGTLLAPGNILNFGGRRFRILDFERVAAPDVTPAQISAIGFKKDTPEEEQEAFRRWLHDIGDHAHVFLYNVEALERESNEPLAPT